MAVLYFMTAMHDDTFLYRYPLRTEPFSSPFCVPLCLFLSHSCVALGMLASLYMLVPLESGLLCVFFFGVQVPLLSV